LADPFRDRWPLLGADTAACTGGTAAPASAFAGGDRYGGWTLVVAYRVAGEPVRNLSVYDGR
jgi:hypothetical protein